MIRLFAALALPPDIVSTLVPLQTGIEGARWRPVEALHITLRFFGDVSEPVADDLDAALAEITRSGFELSLAGSGAFGRGRELHAVWAGVAESEPLRVLAGRCERAARTAGLKPDTHRYTPHVTLAYLRHPDEDQVGAWISGANLFKSASFKVSQFGLYSSWSGHGGNHYRLERTYHLA